MNFSLDGNIEKEKAFIVNRSQLEGRLEPEYYVPSLVKLENKVRKKTTKKLRHYIKSISSGATPSKSKKEKYYSDKHNGLPFLRVQNLQTNSKLNFNNLKYINSETHNGLLKRSQVEAGDLLVKITGVGRMAIASVVPEDFEGNTNQHMVVIKTGSREISEYLANFLNLDLVEKLASRRATGATRPALDYPALKSIPIIANLDFSALENAYKIKSQKEAKAQSLLNSIDDYLLGELGIILPEKDNSLESRMFTTSFRKVSGERFDPDYYQEYYRLLESAISKSNYETAELKSLTHFLKNGKTPSSSEYSEKETSFPIVKVGSYKGKNIDQNKVGYTISPNQSINIKKDDIFILSAAHQAEYVGKHIKILDEDPFHQTAYVGELINVRSDQAVCNPIYLFSVLNLEIFKTLINRERTGQTSHVYGKDLQKISIPKPALEKQNEIAEHIRKLRTKARQLKKEATQAVENARKQIEEMILKNHQEESQD